MSRLIATVGLPGSGKSTWAKQEKARLEAKKVDVCVVCKDDIRKEWAKSGWKWSHEEEKKVIAERDRLITVALKIGFTVICADTNFGKHIDALRKLAAKCKAEFVIQDFTHVDLETCIARDAQRAEEDRVGANVIRSMYARYIMTAPEKYEPNAGKPLALICDLDGTIAIHDGRSPYAYHKCMTDKLNEVVANIVRLHAANGFTILYVSGRDDSCLFLTKSWLIDNKMPMSEPHRLLMRKTGDKRQDTLVKREIFDHCIRENYNVRFVLDDRNQVVRMWRDLGLTCLQVADGAF